MEGQRGASPLVLSGVTDAFEISVCAFTYGGDETGVSKSDRVRMRSASEIRPARALVGCMSRRSD